LLAAPQFPSPLKPVSLLHYSQQPHSTTLQRPSSQQLSVQGTALRLHLPHGQKVVVSKNFCKQSARRSPLLLLPPAPLPLLRRSLQLLSDPLLRFVLQACSATLQRPSSQQPTELPEQPTELPAQTASQPTELPAQTASERPLNSQQPLPPRGPFWQLPPYLTPVQGSLPPRLSLLDPPSFVQQASSASPQQLLGQMLLSPEQPVRWQHPLPLGGPFLQLLRSLSSARSLRELQEPLSRPLHLLAPPPSSEQAFELHTLLTSEQPLRSQHSLPPR